MLTQDQSWSHGRWISEATAESAESPSASLPSNLWPQFPSGTLEGREAQGRQCAQRIGPCRTPRPNRSGFMPPRDEDVVNTVGFLIKDSNSIMKMPSPRVHHWILRLGKPNPHARCARVEK